MSITEWEDWALLPLLVMVLLPPRESLDTVDAASDSPSSIPPRACLDVLPDTLRNAKTRGAAHRGRTGSGVLSVLPEDLDPTLLRRVAVEEEMEVAVVVVDGSTESPSSAAVS